MQWMRKIMIIGFALVIFTGTVGINVFTHFCKVDGVDYSYIMPTDHSCKTEPEVESCCHKPAEKHHADKQAKIDTNCCKEEMSSYKISSDYIQKSSPSPVLTFTPIRPLIHNFAGQPDLEAEPALSAEVTRPPPKTGQEILILNQVFRI